MEIREFWGEYYTVRKRPKERKNGWKREENVEKVWGWGEIHEKCGIWEVVVQDCDIYNYQHINFTLY